MGDVGRPTTWEDIKEKLILVEGWARDGLVNEQIASNLGVSRSTFYKIKSEHKELSDALKKGKEVIDFEVENALLKRALGYEYIEETDSDKDGKRTVTKNVAGDVTAQIFWLKNRKPTVWRDKQEVQVNSENINTNIVSLGEMLKNPVADRDVEE